MDTAWLITGIILSITVSAYSYFIGYIMGFKKSKDIDDKIIDNLRKKYNIQK
jgi:hypothetical protein